MALIYLVCVAWIIFAFFLSLGSAIQVKGFERLSKWKKRKVVVFTWIIIGWLPASVVFGLAKVVL